jgi:hypothetical protein
LARPRGRFASGERKIGPPALTSVLLEEEQHMVTPAKFMLAILAFIAMMVVIGLMVVLPDTGHYANIAH